MAIGAVMACAGLAVGALSEQWTPVRQAVEVPVEALPDDTRPARATPAQAVATPDAASPSEPVSSVPPDRLNLADLYPDGSEEGGPGAVSYAEQIYAVLSAREAQWNSEIYDLYNQTPASVAARLGVPAAQLLGRYTPGAEGHSPTDPATWIVPEFGGIQVSYLNGDEAASEWRSNIKDIMAMTNVYQYYEPETSLEDLEDYALGLWEESHGYTRQVSPVYYCEGCLGEGVEAAETVAESGGGTALAAGVELDGGEAADGSGVDAAESGAGAGTASMEADAAGGSAGAAVAGNDVGAAGASTGTAGTNAGAAGNSAGTAGTNAGATETGTGEGNTATAENSTDTAEAGSTAMAAESAANGTAAADPSAATAGSDPAGSAPTAAESGAEESDREKVIVEGVDGGPGVTALLAEASAAAARADSRTYTCPGHVDLQIQLQVAGLTETGSLFARDSRGNDPAQIREGGWPGWNEENRSYVRTLADEDWYESYGLTVEGVVVRNPLTALDIDLYMKMVPEGVTAQRRNIVRYALSSVGRIPYYWGGKPGKTGYEGNQFGVVVSPDEDGRFLKGLDCSGWINWVYWSATGKRLAGESTSTLVSCGKAIGKDDLLPGDICIRPGETAHVVMFLGWTAEGQMLCIQETSGNINNVEVGITVPDWPHYRRLID